MCGIAGMIGARAERGGSVAGGWLDALHHRGPDDRGEELVAPAAWLAQTRLSILDLSPAGHQPMWSADRRYAVVYNGEIYNFVELRAELEALGRTFRSGTDTEVLMQAWAEWGAAVLPRLTGMFAFALVDTVERTCTLARDPFGIKPLFWTWSDGTLAFASEIRPLLESAGVSRRVSPERIYRYLRYGLTDEGDRTMWEAVRQFPAASVATISLDAPGAPEPTPYWGIDPGARTEVSFEAAAARVRELFCNNVRLHLRSDVRVGGALSGGIDSSAIVCGMREAGGPELDLHAFSYVAEGELSEERWVDIVGAATGAQVHKVRITPEELVADLDGLIAQQGEPFGSTSIYAQYRVFRLAKEAGVTVMLDGQGADEILGGYTPYLGARFASLVRQGRWGAARRFLKAAGARSGKSARRIALESAAVLLPPAMQGPLRRLAGKSLMPPWMHEAWFDAHGVRPSPVSHVPGTDKLRNMLADSVTSSSLPRLLRYEDRNSMAWSLESRVPFLTTELVSYLLSLPEEYLIDMEGGRKSVFRAAMRGLVPGPILDRHDKIGFATPEERWLEQLAPWVESVLGSDRARAIPALKFDGIQAEWHAVRAGKAPFDWRVWRWINLVRWADLNEAEFPA